MDDLKHLLSAYFYELLLRTLGRARVRLVGTRGRRLRQRSPERAARVPVQIDDLLAASRSDEMLSHAMVALGCCYAPAEGDRLWLLAVRDRLGEATPNQDVHRT